MSYSRVAVVTGANKGLGYGIVRNLALQYPKSALNNGKFLIYLTARDKTRGETALKELESDDQLLKAKALTKDGGLTDVKFKQLDITQPENVTAFRDFLNQEHPDGIDILINNAGMAMNGFDNNVVHTTLHTNYHSTLNMTTTLLPTLRAHGRLINIASLTGHLSRFPAALQQRFTRAAAASAADVTALMREFEADVAAGTHAANGWPSAAYANSKAGCIGVTRAVAAEYLAGKFAEEGAREGLRINSCCPGYVNTDMTKGRGVLTLDQGARTPVHLALGDIGDANGEFWQKEKISEW